MFALESDGIGESNELNDQAYGACVKGVLPVLSSPSLEVE